MSSYIRGVRTKNYSKGKQYYFSDPIEMTPKIQKKKNLFYLYLTPNICGVTSRSLT